MSDIHASRLTDADLARMTRRARETLAMWRDASMNPRALKVTSVDREALRRSVYGSIGCSAYDLRDAELEQAERLIEAAVDAFTVR